MNYLLLIYLLLIPFPGNSAEPDPFACRRVISNARSDSAKLANEMVEKKLARTAKELKGARCGDEEDVVEALKENTHKTFFSYESPIEKAFNLLVDLDANKDYKIRDRNDFFEGILEYLEYSGIESKAIEGLVQFAESSRYNSLEDLVSDLKNDSNFLSELLSSMGKKEQEELFYFFGKNFSGGNSKIIHSVLKLKL